MKRSKWLALNSLLAVLATGLAVVDLIDHARGGETVRWEHRGSDRASGPDERIVRAGAAICADGGSPHTGAADVPQRAAGRAGAEPLRSPKSATSPASPVPAAPTGAWSPETIAAGLGWTEPVVASMEPPRAPEVLDAPWLAFIGSVTQADGECFYFFKDERTGAVIRLSAARPIEGWTLEVSSADEYLIEKGGEYYRARGRR